MSKFNTRASLIAAAVALALPASALAVTAGYPAGATNTYASNVVNSSTTSLEIAEGATFGITATDNLAGRTAGFGVRITLTGAQFSTATGATEPTVTVSADQADTTFDGATTVTENVSGSVALFSVGVNTANTAGMKVGDVLDINAFTISNITAPTVTARIEIYDPTTNQVLASATPYVLFNTQEAVRMTFVQADSDAPGKRIDVVTGDTYEAKTAFSPDGSLGGSEGAGGEELYFNAGALTLGVSQFGPSGSRRNVLDVDGTAFEYTTGDMMTYTVTSTSSLEGFESIWLADFETCDTTGGIEGEVEGNVVSFEFDAAALHTFHEGGGASYLCFFTDGDTVIQAQSFTATGEVDFTTAGVTDWTGPVTENPLPMRYNGSVIQLFNVNPASNTTQESLLRYTNNSNLDYRVTLTGRDDAGNASAGSFTFDLDAGESISLRSVEIENGNPAKGTGALGAGTGKWVIEATAEGTGLVASGLNRSALTGVISELNSEKHTDPADGTVVRPDLRDLP